MNATLSRPVTTGLTTIPTPAPKKRKPVTHEYHGFQNDGSAECVSGRSGEHYAVSADTCGCDRIWEFHAPSCSHRDQLRQNLAIAETARPGARLNRVGRSGPCPACGSTTRALLMSGPTPPDYTTPTVELLEVYCPQCGRVRE